jgi:septum site-determining protein MinD
MIHNLTVLSSAKGGVGKSTVAAGLACGFALRSQKTVVFDLNPLCGNVAAFLGEAVCSPFHLGDVVNGLCSLQDAIAVSGQMENIFVTLPPQSLADFPDEVTLVQWLLMVSPLFDQILIDLPHWAPCFGAAARYADTTLLISTTDRCSVACCDRLRTSPHGQQMHNPKLVLNRFHRRQFWEAGEFEDLDQVMDVCGLPLLGVIPNDRNFPSHLSHAMHATLDYNHQIFHQQRGGGAIALHCLADRLLGQVVPLRDLDRL